MYLLVSLCDPGWTYFFFLPQHLLVATPSEPNSNRFARANDGTAVGSLENNEFLPFESGTWKIVTPLYVIAQRTPTPATASCEFASY